ncbi:hypothetical protein [Gynuella sunshinyii]|uniref:Uncharacterized protein n=1 Tax=Gynuella sunshinyii YC6258 TaxID=1445510 RepID=A0A0C5VHI0_9GAMM|nr:hypothetical protein [Gynuella sunshinyii]AJQ92773.1 hypothetical Protein YC6258_00723 [Gynuella sunshinyii YC6258]
MSVPQLRAIIKEAIELEDTAGYMRKMVMARLNLLHHCVRLPSEDPVTKIVNFVKSYIAALPDCIAEIRAVSSQAGVYNFVEPFLTVAEAFIVSPPSFTQGRHSLDTLISGAYVTHRLIEEVNDIFMSRTRFPLIPLDMTMSNLLVHELIGEPHSNDLDQTAEELVRQITEKTEVFQSEAFQQFVASSREDTPKHWDSLTMELDLDLFEKVRA